MTTIEFFNTDFAKLLVLLLAIFAMFCIGLKYKPKSDNNKSIHIWYICGISALIIIGLLSYITINNEHSADIMNYVSFASTLSSMILSVLAIFITVLSNESLGRVKDALIDLPMNVRSSVETSINEMQKVSETVKQMSDQNSNSQAETISKIKDLLSNMEIHLNDEFSRTSEKITKMDSKLADLTRTNSLKGSTSTIVTKEIADKFLQNTSYLSLQIICAWDEYEKHNVSSPVSIDRLLNCFGYEDASALHMYVFACIVLLNSFDILEYSQVDRDNYDLIMVGGIDSTFRARFLPHFDATDNSKQTRDRLEKYYKELCDNIADSDQPQ